MSFRGAGVGDRPLGRRWVIAHGGDRSDDLQRVGLESRRAVYVLRGHPTLGVDVFDHEPETGQLTNRRRLIDIEGAGPDGLTVDAQGAIWVALFGAWALARYSAQGVVDRIARVPARFVTSCTFGGPDLATLYVTTARRRLSPEALVEQPHAGGILAYNAGVPGQQSGRVVAMSAASWVLSPPYPLNFVFERRRSR